MTAAGSDDGRSLQLFHTADAHIATCNGLLADLAPGLPVHHVVRADLLAQAVAAGGLVQNVHDAAAAAIVDLAAEAAVILCTCSTLGPAAWTAAAHTTVPVLRIDEPMAVRAVETGRRIGVAACLASTLGPTRELLDGVAQRQGRTIELHDLLIEDAWPLFEAGEIDRYADHIAKVLQRRDDLEVIVLAQASMAPAAALVTTAVPVLSSPRLGLAAAVDAWQRLKEQG